VICQSIDPAGETMVWSCAMQAGLRAGAGQFKPNERTSRAYFTSVDGLRWSAPGPVKRSLIFAGADVDDSWDRTLTPQNAPSGSRNHVTISQSVTPANFVRSGRLSAQQRDACGLPHEMHVKASPSVLPEHFVLRLFRRARNHMSTGHLGHQ
jgi:hypothetical protein